MDSSPYLDVNFTLPQVGVAVAGVLLLAGIPLLLHGSIRRRRFALLGDGLRTYALRSSIRAELVIGATALVSAALLVLYGYLGYTAAMDHLRSNIEQKYHPTELVMGEFNGSWVTVDITLPDGTTFTDCQVQIRSGNEPFIEQVWYHYHPQAADG